MKRLHLELHLTWKYVAIILLIVGVSAILTFFPSITTPSVEGEKKPVPTTTCKDTDGGMLPSVKGTCSDTENYTDNCLTDHVVAEYACEEGFCIRKSLNCITIGMECRNGTCSPPPSEEVVEIPNESTTTVFYPDLRVISINQYKTNVSGENGTRNLTILLDFAIENIGNRPSIDSVLNVSLTGPMDRFQYVFTPIIYEKQIGIVNASFSVNNLTGTYTVHATADVHNRVEEADETNNEYQASFVID